MQTSFNNFEMTETKELSEERVESANISPQQMEPKVTEEKSLQNTVKAFLDWARVGIIVFLVIILALGFIYNILAPSEKDIPDHVFNQLFNLIQQGGTYPKLLPISDENLKGKQLEWKPSPCLRTNETVS